MNSQTTNEPDHTGDLPAADFEVIDALNEIYLDAGLAPAHALLSAYADYTCNFQTELSHAA